MTVLATVLQLVVVVLILVTVMLWPGWPWLLALTLAVLGLPFVLDVAKRIGRSALVLMLLAVPPASAGAAVALAAYDAQRVADAACSDREKAAVAGLRLPSGEPLEFVGTSDNTCDASVPIEMVTVQARKDFAATLRAHGWTVDNPAGPRIAHKGRVVMFLSPPESGTGMDISVDDNW